jgi:hypothetical protein
VNSTTPAFTIKLFNWTILHFSLRKLIFLFLFLSIVSTIIYQTVIVYPQISVNHPFSDVLIYSKMAFGELNYFGPTHITHRVLLPSILSVFSSLPVWSFGFTTALFNLFVLILVLKRVYEQKDGMSFSLFSIVLVSLPAFWRGFFLPMPDTLLWAFLTLFWLEFIREKPSPIILFILFFLALLTKEMAILSLIFVFSTIPVKRYSLLIPVILAVLCVVLFDWYFSFNYSNNYVLNPSFWLSDWFKNVAVESLWIPKYILSGFSFILLFWLFRFFVSKTHSVKDVLPELILFILIFLFAATNSPRILFPFTGIMAIRMMQKSFVEL